MAMGAKLDEYKRPVRVDTVQYRYMGHFIDDQREWVGRGLPPWATIGDTSDCGYHGHSSFADAKAYCKKNRIDNPDTQVSDYI